MVDAALGVKRRCASCEAPFYDLARDPIRCPKCSAVFVVPPPSARRSRVAKARPVPVPKPPVVELPEVEDEEADDVPPADDDVEPAEDEEAPVEAER